MPKKEIAPCHDPMLRELDSIGSEISDCLEFHTCSIYVYCQSFKNSYGLFERMAWSALFVYVYVYYRLIHTANHTLYATHQIELSRKGQYK